MLVAALNRGSDQSDPLPAQRLASVPVAVAAPQNLVAESNAEASAAETALAQLPAVRESADKPPAAEPTFTEWPVIAATPSDATPEEEDEQAKQPPANRIAALPNAEIGPLPPEPEQTSPAQVTPEQEIAGDFDAAWIEEEKLESPSEPWNPPTTTTAEAQATIMPIVEVPAAEILATAEIVPTVVPYTPAVAPYTPTIAELSAQLLPAVQEGFRLARHGAIFAARAEFIQVLRRVAQAKDAAAGIDTHSGSLAAGLRALDEADDFLPRGTQLEAELNVAVVASSHRTPVLAGRGAVQSQEAVALYHLFARDELAKAVAGEQAGSMALYGLGKVQNRLARDAEGELRHERKAMTLFQAALNAGPGNHLAANEVGVLLTRGGQPAEAVPLFQRAIDIAPTSTAYHNLAVAERTLGNHAQAAANEQYAQHLAARDRATGVASRARGVQWVAPQDLSRVAAGVPPAPLAAPPQRLPEPVGAVETAAKWPMKLIPSAFRR